MWSPGGSQNDQSASPPQTLASPCSETRRQSEQNSLSEPHASPEELKTKKQSEFKSPAAEAFKRAGIGEGTKGFPCGVWIGTVALLSTQQRVGSKEFPERKPKLAFTIECYCYECFLKTGRLCVSSSSFDSVI